MIYVRSYLLLFTLLIAYTVAIIPCGTLDEEERWRWSSFDHRRAQEIENKSRTFLKDGMWGTKQYCLPEYTSYTQITPLIAESVSTPFFIQLANKDEKDKIAVLEIAVRHPEDPSHREWYLERRANIAATVLVAKINLKALGEHHHLSLLHQAVDYRDFHLIQLLIDNGASVHECNGFCNGLHHKTPIFNVNRKKIALRFIECGALQDGHAATLLHHHMNGNNDKLISFYIQQGISPFSTNELGNTALFNLAAFDSWRPSSISKAKVLMETLSAEQKINLITHTNHAGENVFDIISWWKVNLSTRQNVERLHELQQFLEQKRDSAKEENCK